MLQLGSVRRMRVWGKFRVYGDLELKCETEILEPSFFLLQGFYEGLKV